MLGIATKQYLNTTARSDNDAGVPFPTHRRRHRIEGPQTRYSAFGDPIHLRCRDGSKGLLTQLSPSLLASGSILCRREVISFQAEPISWRPGDKRI